MLAALRRRFRPTADPDDLTLEMQPYRAPRRTQRLRLNSIELPASLWWWQRRKLRRVLEAHVATMKVPTHAEALERLGRIEGEE
jgi:hypothetical protein